MRVVAQMIMDQAANNFRQAAIKSADEPPGTWIDATMWFGAFLVLLGVSVVIIQQLRVYRSGRVDKARL